MNRDSVIFDAAKNELELLNRANTEKDDKRRLLLLAIMKASAEYENDAEKKAVDYVTLSIIVLNEADLMDFFTPSPRPLAPVSEGLAYLEKAIELGNPEATRMLGTLYAEGRFVKEDEKKAKELLASPDTAFPQFTYLDVIRYYKSRDPAKAFHYAELSDKNDDDWSARLSLVRFLLEGCGCAKDPARAVTILNKLTTKYHPEPVPCYLLAYCYLNGVGVSKDPTKAKSYYRTYEQYEEHHYIDEWLKDYPLGAKDFE